MTGKIVQVSGSVVDVRFEPGHLPKIKEALVVKLEDKEVVMEVAQHIGDYTVRCIMLAGSEGLARNMDVIATGNNIQVPVEQMAEELMEVEVNDEVGIVTSAFNKMVINLRNFIEQLKVSIENENEMKE